MMDKGSAIFEGLNAEQREAVSRVEGPELIVAGAGSGKTRVLTSRIAYMLERGVDPSRIMALTFTKKAATEMKERIALMVGYRSARKLFMGTFHSIFIRFLREYAASIGYQPTFTIYDTSDSQGAIKACVKELGLDDKVYKPRDVLSRISLAKNNLFTASAYCADQRILTEDSRSRKPRICDIYSLYAKKCRESGVMDFDDILLNMNILLRHDPVAKESISSRFDYIMVDEYQDTNFSQYLILKELSQKHRNICVVGDDSQSIYGFRGAKIENILNFKKDYPECEVVRLVKNYRSTSTIVNAANSLIEKNTNRIPKECVAVGEEGDKIKVLSNYTEQDEAKAVASEIVGLMRRKHAQYKDFAILYRTNKQSRAIEEALRNANLPYVTYSGNSFYDRAEVRTMLAYMKLVVNVNDDESFKRVVNMPARGIGETSMTALQSMAASLGLSLFKAAYSDRFAEFGLKPAAIGRIRSFCDMIDKLAAKASVTPAKSLAIELSDVCGLYASFKADQSMESQGRAENIEELVNSVTQYMEDTQAAYVADLDTDADIEDIELPLVTLGEFLENISLLSKAEQEDGRDDEDVNNKVALMTVHTAKGLEFPHVFVTGMEDKIFPSGGMLASPADIEEERRLFYVALTRAKEDVFLSFAQTRIKNGERQADSPSRFMKEIDPRYFEDPDWYDSEDSSSAPSGGFSGFGRYGSSGFGSSSQRQGSTKYGGTRYGMSGDVKYFKYTERKSSAAPSSTVSSRPSFAAQVQAVKGRQLPPKVDDAEFNAVPAAALMAKVKVGDSIVHNRFGPGKIVELSGSAPDMKAKISFKDYGDKILLLKFAKLRFE